MRTALHVALRLSLCASQTGEISCAISFPWVEEGDTSLGHLKPPFQSPLVTLYDGVGMVGNGRKPLVMAALGAGDGAFLVSWRVFDDNRSVWDIPAPSDGKAVFECIGTRLYYSSFEVFTIYDAVVSTLYSRRRANLTEVFTAVGPAPLDISPQPGVHDQRVLGIEIYQPPAVAKGWVDTGYCPCPGHRVWVQERWHVWFEYPG